MTPIESYRLKCNNGTITEDPQQLLALERFQLIYDQLIQEHRRRSKLFSMLRKSRLIKGLYIWGGVGIGKTLMMDCFYDCLPFKNKLRMHFHAFMQMIQQQLKIHQGERDPLQKIAENIAKDNIVLCFDEFIVADVVDAMILARLLKALFSLGVCLVTTSNTEANELYKNGLQRISFLPAIAQLNEHTHVMHINSKVDYRLRYFKQVGIYYTPNNAIADQHMREFFHMLATTDEISTDVIHINDRQIKIKKQCGDMIWFDFKAICQPPRSQHDYLALTKTYKLFFISNVPNIKPDDYNTIALFIRLIDVLYDAQACLVLSAATTAEKLYTDGKYIGDYQRTCSRLVEMQSYEYFSRVRTL